LRRKWYLVVSALRCEPEEFQKQGLVYGRLMSARRYARK
jgi:hypothetical protein